MRIAYFDCFSGAAGDMIVASLLDAGADKAAFVRQLEGLGLAGYRITIEKTRKQGLAATRFDIQLDATAEQPHRHLEHILAILDAGSLPPQVLAMARSIFTRLAEAEAAVHDIGVDKVHFHEVGAVDAILDIVGAATALDLLGIEQVHSSPLTVGSGMVRCAHGLLPVPAPATADLIKGIPIAPTSEVGELLTPTGAAILTTLAAGFGPHPAMRVEAVGYGAGTREGIAVPNLLRVLIGETSSEGESDCAAVLEASIDDATPEMVAHCLDRLMAEGALDAFTMPINMKKSRTGLLLTVLCALDAVESMQTIVFAETTTFGVRRHDCVRAKLSRRHEEVATPYGPIRMKVGRRGSVTTASPEFEDCRKAALEHRVALRSVMDAARSAWQQQHGNL